MKFIIRIVLLLVCAGLVPGARLFAAEPVSDSAPPTSETFTQNVVNGYLQIQAQLHDAELAIEKSRQEAAAQAKLNTDMLTARIQTLEDTLAAQRASAAEAAQKNQQFTLLMAVAFGLTVLAAVMFMAYLQWRAVTRLVEMSASRSQELALGGARVAPSLMSGAAVEQSNEKLFSVVDQLQKRIQELEQSSRATLADSSAPAANGSPVVGPPESGSPVPDDWQECVANLLAEGQALLDANAPGKALECFDAALELDPKHAEALVKKGGALEKLGRPDEAIACYDNAIEANATLTIAHLHKGGLFNRLARYDEALQCYEEALRTQEKKMPGEKIAA